MTSERIPLGMRLSERFGRWAMQRLAGEIVVSGLPSSPAKALATVSLFMRSVPVTSMFWIANSGVKKVAPTRTIKTIGEKTAKILVQSEKTPSREGVLSRFCFRLSRTRSLAKSSRSGRFI
jgi:hypothetical protein